MPVGRRGITWGLVAAATVALLVYTLQPAPVAVDIGTVTRETLVVTVAEEGETRLRRRFAVSAPVSGRVQRIETRAGDTVRAGELIATIRPARPAPLDARSRAAAEARVRSATAALEGAHADRRRLEALRAQAAREAARTRTLFEAGSVAREAVETADLAAESAEEALRAGDAAVRAAEFAVAEAKAALLSSTSETDAAEVPVRAPIDGVVLRRVQESETVIAAGSPLIEVGDLRDLEIVADLLSTDAVRVKRGAPVVITNWGDDRDLNGRVDRVEPSGFTKVSALGVEEQRVNVVVAFDDPPEERPDLGDGFRVEVRIALSEHPDVLAVPTASLFRRGGKWAVFVVDRDHRVAAREVEIGAQNERIAAVTRGLSEGERVVLYPGESLADGVEVTPSGLDD